jgi:hypothetical protein
MRARVRRRFRVNFFRRFLRDKSDQVKDWENPDREANPMACPEIELDGINQPLYANLLSEATAAGAKFDGTKATLDGIELDWNYSPEVQILRVSCAKKPFFVTCAEVESHIHDLVNKAKAAI